MGVNVTFNGAVYTIPVQGDTRWGPEVTRYLVALAAHAISPAGGLYPLTSDLNLGPSFGLVSPYYKSSSTNIASDGFLRLGNTDLIEWRNYANSGNDTLGVNSSDQLVYNGSPLQPLMTLADGYIWVGNGTNTPTAVLLSGAITTTDTGVTSLASNYIINSMVYSGAGIAYTKLASLSASIVPVTNGSGFLTSSSTTATQLSYLDATSSIQTQLNAITSGSVTSITGTANEITASSPTGAVTLSTPSTFIAPGSIAATTTLSGTKLYVGSASVVGNIVFVSPTDAVNPEIAIGLNALHSHTSGIDEIAIGGGTLSQDISGTENIGIGSDALLFLTTGSSNVSIGNGSTGGNSTAPLGNTMIGTSSGENWSGTPQYNTAVGETSLPTVSGSGNVAVGQGAGAGVAGVALTSGTNNTLLGYQSDTAAANSTNAIAIGYQAVAASNSTVIGNSSTTAARIYGNLTSTFSTLTSSTAHPASIGVIRLANTDYIAFRNGANNADLVFTASATQFEMSAPLLITPTSNQLVLGSAGATNFVTISATTPATSQTYTMPDAGGSANFVFDKGNYTIAGTWSFSNAVTASVTGHSSLDLALSGGTMSGAIAMGTNKITGLGNGSAAQDAAAFGQITAANAGALPLAGGQLTGNLTFDNYSTHGVHGTATNDNAAAGNIGEFITSTATTGAPVSLTSGVAVNITSISLTAGDWDVFGIVGYIPTGAFSTAQQSSSAVSATLGGDDTVTYISTAGLANGGRYVIGTKRYSLSTTTTIYLIAAPGFAGTCTGFGTISGRRAR